MLIDTYSLDLACARARALVGEAVAIELCNYFHGKGDMVRAEVAMFNAIEDGIAAQDMLDEMYYEPDEELENDTCYGGYHGNACECHNFHSEPAPLPSYYEERDELPF